jgi:hypothetical protein
VSNPTNSPSMPPAQPSPAYPYATPHYLVDIYGNPFSSSNPVPTLLQIGSVVSPIDGQKATYRATITALAAVTGCTDLLTLTGSSTKTVRVTRVEFSGTIATGAMYLDVLGILRSTADTSGTKTNPSAIPLDSSDAAATAVITAYTANPTLGTSIGTIRADKALLQLTGTPAQPDRLIWTFGERPGARAVVLRGVAQQFCINLNAVTISNATLINIALEFTEES